MTRRIRLMHAATFGLVALAIGGCASPDSRGVDAEKWVRSEVIPLEKSQPERALALLRQRFDDECVPTERLGKSSFRAALRGTSRENNNQACKAYNEEIAWLLYSTGQYQKAIPHLTQVWWSRETARTYNETDCIKLSYLGVYDSVRTTVPFSTAYFDTLDRTQNANAGKFLHKAYLCELKMYTSPENLTTRETFAAAARKYFGEQAERDVRTYVDVIHVKMAAASYNLVVGNGALEQGYRESAGRYAKEAELYRNAIAASRRLGLDRPLNGQPSPYVTHLGTLAAEADRQVQLNSSLAVQYNE
ncbi:hypothetical protein R82526_01201 [Ralstonia mannitolilytica]|uniref:hypothetical protein n=1 Tax=Ralstonia mannitolilytica TaxID=105219 RepID=UPI0007B021B0|nr:hypothetical protein [Ralstonia mannitolilytica]ANA33280.1 hypothetical protein VZ52_07590 [Ralstonia mannitolilytica]CAJ0681381.1 hypothetical protein R82526_01201 [Ralstonia mannitolilytica]CAJ0894541.1 hypothetical protein R76727_04534 [Ralstonia mannitolilytica]